VPIIEMPTAKPRSRDTGGEQAHDDVSLHGDRVTGLKELTALAGQHPLRKKGKGLVSDSIKERP
jgi:hypothetical protein